MKDAICCAVPYTPPRCFSGALTITVRELRSPETWMSGLHVQVGGAPGYMAA